MLKTPSRLRAVFLAATISAAGLLSTTASAEGTAAISLAHVDSKTGIEFSVGAKNAGTGLYLAPSAGLFVYRGDNKDFSMQTQRNGTEVCRDVHTGQYAEKSQCNNIAVNAFATLETGYQFQAGSLGVGVRVGETATPFLAATVGKVGRGHFRVAAGKDYAAMGLAGSF